MSTLTKEKKAEKPEPKKQDRTSLPKDTPEDLNITLETDELRKFGYALSKKFLGKGAYARVYLATPSPMKIQNNYKLRLQQRKYDQPLKVHYILFLRTFVKFSLSKCRTTYQQLFFKYSFET